MNMDDAAARILRGHARLLVVCLLLPILAVVALQLRAQPLYRSTERVQLGLTVASSNVEADAVSTKAAALVTSPGAVQKAVNAAHVQRDIETLVVERIEVVRVGLSAVVDLSVSDPDPRAARAITGSLGAQLLSLQNTAGRGSEGQALRALDRTQVGLEADREKVLALMELDPLADSVAVRRSRLTSIDNELAELSNQRGKLTLQQAARPSAVVLDPASLPLRALSTGLSQALELAVLVGLLLGLGSAAALELLRPSVPSPRSLARLLRAPLLGTVARDTDVAAHAAHADGQDAALRELAERIAVTARRNDLGAVVLVPVAGCDRQLLARVAAAGSALEAGALVPSQEPALTPGSGGQARRPTAVVRPALRWHVTSSSGPQEAVSGGGRGYGALDGMLAREDRRAGAVVVAPTRLHLRDLDDGRDLLDATGWPLLGVVAVGGRR